MAGKGKSGGPSLCIGLAKAQEKRYALSGAMSLVLVSIDITLYPMLQ